jgi:MFS family permease
VTALFSAQLATALVPFGIGALAPFLRVEYDLTRGQVGLANSLIFACVAACSIPAGSVVDRVGVARSLFLSCAAVGIGALGLAAFDGYAGLAVALMVVGVGYAVISPATNKGVLVAAPAPKRGSMMGIKQTGVTMGAALAAATLPRSVERIGIRSTLLILAGVIVAIGVIVSLAYRRIVGEARTKGALASEGLPVRTGSVRRIVILGSVVGTMVAAQHAVATYLTLFLVDRRAMSATGAAGLLTLLHVSGSGARFGWGWVSDRQANRIVTIVIIGSITVGSLLVLAAVGATLPYPALVLLVVALGLATQGGNAVYQTAIAEEDEARAGWASGVGMTLGFTGAIIAPPVFGATVDATDSYSLAWTMTAGVVAIGVAVASVLAHARRAAITQPA